MTRVAGTYSLEWDPEAEDELEELRPFDSRSIPVAIRELRYEAEVVTRNRKPLKEPIRSIPRATWELRVGDHRVLYDVRKHRIVRVLRVIFKGPADDRRGRREWP